MATITGRCLALTLCVSGAPAPSKRHYKLVTQAPQTARLEPPYTAGEITPTELLGAVGVDQFRQRHLAPLMHLTPQQVQQWLQWTPANIPTLVITVPRIRKIIRKANRTSPFRDLLEYMHVGLLKDNHLDSLAALYNRAITGEPNSVLYQGDFYTLPNKLPHGPIANARPLLNFATPWKILSGCVKDHLAPFLCAAEIIPTTQFALWGGSSTVDLLRVLHDYAESRWAHGLAVILLMDDVRHAFGSVPHDTLRALLISAGVDPDIVELILGAAEKANIFMGGDWGVLIAMTTFSAGITQGCPLPALVFCLAIQLRIAIVTALTPSSDSPAGPLSHLSYIDDVTFTPPTVPALRTTTARLPVAGVQTHLHSAPLKAKGFVVRKVGTQYKFEDPGIVVGGVFLSMAKVHQYIRVVGRHALPRFFHREEYIKMMKSSVAGQP